VEFGILGLEQSGKSTLFSLLTGHGAAPHGRQAHVGVAHVPDPRLEALGSAFPGRKVIPATVQFVDVPAIARGASQALNLPELRTMDGLAVVLRGFASDAVPHPEGRVEPARDLELVETELLLADMAVASSRLERLEREAGKRKASELAAERDALTPCRAALEAGTPLRQLELSPEQHRILKGFTFLTLKPLLVLLNAGEDAAGDLAGAVGRAGLERWQHQPKVVVSAVCATLEQEIARLAPGDQAAFLADLGLPDRALDRVLRAAFDLLGLISFFTLNESECRAWPVRAGTSALHAAGTIHSDLERGFIRAEVVRWQELVAAGSLAECRAHATLRLEGKDYVVQDGDVVLVRFHV
jgi:hypothetical protein